MVDPVTAIGLATGAFNSIKTMISTGKDIQDMAGQIGQWGKAISDLDYASAKADKPKWYKALGGGVQANAVETWMHITECCREHVNSKRVLVWLAVLRMYITPG